MGSVSGISKRNRTGLVRCQPLPANYNKEGE